MEEEKVEKKVAERSPNFSLTCSLLSQFMKDNGSFPGGGLRLGMPKGIFRPATTMNLMPGVVEDHIKDGTGKNVTEYLNSIASNKEEKTKSAPNSMDPEKAQLTIFYGGKVLVFDNFPADTAKILMEMASKEKEKPSAHLGASTLMSSASSYQKPPLSQAAAAKNGLPTPLQANASDMPIARRNSLHRFLEKRKDRVGAQAPYQVNGSSTTINAAKEDDHSKAWLGLGQQASEKNICS